MGFTHLRVPDQVARPDSGPLHESVTFLAWLAGQTDTIELVPSVVVLPSRQTVLFAKQSAQIDILSGGRLRLGIGVGGCSLALRKGLIETFAITVPLKNCSDLLSSDPRGLCRKR